MNLEVARVNGALLVQLPDRTKLIGPAAEEFHRLLVAEVSVANGTYCLDLRNAEEVDARAIKALLWLQSAAVRDGGTVKIVGLSAAAKCMIDVFKLRRLLDVVEMAEQRIDAALPVAA